MAPAAGPAPQGIALNQDEGKLSPLAALPRPGRAGQRSGAGPELGTLRAFPPAPSDGDFSAPAASIHALHTGKEGRDRTEQLQAEGEGHEGVTEGQ